MNLAKNPKLGTIEVHKGHGEIVQCDLVQRRKLVKHDRFLDHSTILELEKCTFVELKILFAMFRISNKKNFIADKTIDITIERHTRANAIKSLIEKDIIRKAIWMKGVRTSIKGYMINPFHFRKTRQTEEYFSLLDLYNSFHEEEILLITMKEEDQVMEEYIELKTTLMEN